MPESVEINETNNTMKFQQQRETFLMNHFDNQKITNINGNGQTSNTYRQKDCVN